MRLRLILSFVLVVLVSVTGVVLIARQSTASEVRAFMFRGGMSSDSGLVISLEEYFQVHGSWEGVESELSSRFGHGMGGASGQGMMQGMMNQNLRLADAQGYWVADSNGVLAGQMTEDEKAQAIGLHLGQKTIGYLLAVGGITYNRTDETLLVNRLTRAALIAGMVAGLISLLLAFFLTYKLARPIRELTQAARQLGQGDLTRRVSISGDKDIALLGKTFNQMAGFLQQNVENRRALTADIAHELRNPLAVQRANLEALQDGVYPLTSQNLEPVLEQNRLLTHLVDDLRILALADSGELNLERVPTEFQSLVSRIIERFRSQVGKITIKLMTNPSQEPENTSEWIVQVDPIRLEQILTNLLSNALRYSPEDGVIEVNLDRDSQRIQLTVRDSGPGIPEDALEHIFERFYRHDRSRSRSEGGTGLGLSIARHLAQAHGGNLTAANHPEGGAIFKLTLPIT